MRLSNKALIIIGVVCAGFLGITSIQALRYPFLNFASVTLLSAIITFALFYYVIIDRVEHLNELLKKQSREPKPNPVDMHGHDEVSSIAKSVSYMLESSQSSELHQDQRARELQKINEELSQQLNAHKFSERRIKEDNDCLARIARYDNLSSLPNRVFFNEVLNKSISRAKRHKHILAILIINIDHFKGVMEKLGQEKSDIVLKEISKRFANVVRTEDLLAKFDGDEFAVLLTDINKPKFASTVAEKILHVCSHPIKIDEHEFKLTASVGICVYPNDGYSLESLLISADEALYKAKHTGGNQYLFFARELDVEAREYIQLESALRKALHNNEITLSYQPKIHLKNGNIASLEALLRWEHPVLGIIPPAKFIPIAEENNTIMQLGEWALREACQTSKLWQDQGYEHFTIAMKLSPKQFWHPDIVKMISNVLNKTGLNPKYLEIEITEQTAMDNADDALKILKELKELGLQISMDHFGVGYTSIRYLKQFPISNIKIDRIYVNGLPNNPDDCAITSAIIALAHTLGLEVVAEGVETAEQVQFLSDQGCDMVQGYFLSHPQPAQKIVLQFAKLRDGVLV